MQRILLALGFSFLLCGCGGSDEDASPSNAGGSAGASSGGTGGSGGSGGNTGGNAGAASGGSAGAATGGTAGAAGSAIWFHDDFDTPLPEWTFDPTDPMASYEYDPGVLRITGGSLQAFAWYPVSPEWGNEYEVEITFTIESGLVGGVMLHGADTSAVNAVNCNLREDLDMLRAARHTDRAYLTLNQTPTTVDHGTSYTISARVAGGNQLTCTQEGGPSVSETPLPYQSGAIGLFVYQGTVVFESLTVKP
jgi:hypothetical protein